MDRPLLVLGGFSIVLLVLVLLSVRREHIRVEYSVSWLIAATLLMLVSFNRTTRVMAGRHDGHRRIRRWWLSCSCSAYFWWCLYRFSLRISELKDNNIALAQRLAILEYQYKSTHEEQHQDSKTHLKQPHRRVSEAGMVALGRSALRWSCLWRSRCMDRR